MFIWWARSCHLLLSSFLMRRSRVQHSSPRFLVLMEALLSPRFSSKYGPGIHPGPGPGTVGIGIGAFKTVIGGVPVIEMGGVRSPLDFPLLVSRGTQPSSRRFPEGGLALKEESGEGPILGRGVKREKRRRKNSVV